MKKLYYSLILLVFFGILMALIVHYGIKARAINILKPSYFSTPEEIGAVIFRRFYSEISSDKLLVIGVPAKSVFHHNIVAGLLRVAAHEGKAFDVLFTDPRLPQSEALPPQLKVIPLSINGEDLGDAGALIKSLLAQDKRILVYTYSTMSSHLLAGNTIAQLEKSLKRPVFSITTSQLSLRNDQEYSLEPPCVGSARDETGTADLGCIILQTSRSYYRRNLDPTRYVAVIDQHGRSDYLLLSSGPKDLNSRAETLSPIINSAGAGQPTVDVPPEKKTNKRKNKYYDGSKLSPRGGSTTEIDPNEQVEEDVN